MRLKPRAVQARKPRLRCFYGIGLVIGMVLSPTSPRLWAKGTHPPGSDVREIKPLTAGTITMTIQGTGFTAGALEYNRNGSIPAQDNPGLAPTGHVNETPNHQAP